MSNTKKKILFVITKSNWGGAQRYVFDLALEAQKRGLDVSVCAGGAGVLLERLKEHNLRTIPLYNLGRDVKVMSDFSVFIKLILLFRSEKPDIVHLNSSKIGGLGALAGRIALIKNIIFTAHGFAFNEDRGVLQKVFLKFLYWLIICLCNHTITVSGAMKKQVEHWPGVKNKIQVVHNGVEDFKTLPRDEAREKLAQKSEGLKALLKERPEQILIGSLAELHHIKGHRYALEALKSLSNICFVSIGEGEERGSIEKFIEKNNIQKRVFLLGHIENGREYLKAFDIFSFTSLSEGLGIAVLEAGIAQLPVVGSEAGGIPEIIENNISGLIVQPKDVRGISEAFEKLVKDAPLRKKLGEELRRKILAIFSCEQMFNNTFSLYHLDS